VNAQFLDARRVVIEEALRQQFPDAGLSIDSRNNGARLVATLYLKGKRVSIVSPPVVHAGALSPPEWIDRFARAIRDSQ
jgi:hypothetical protein